MPLDPASDGNERTNVGDRRSCRTSETTLGSPQERWADAGGMNERTEASVTDTSPASGIRPDRAQVPEAPGADNGRFGFGAFAARYQPESFSEDTAWRDWSRVFPTWVGRFQRGRVQEVIRAVEARPGDEATVTELDLKLC